MIWHAEKMKFLRVEIYSLLYVVFLVDHLINSQSSLFLVDHWELVEQKLQWPNSGVAAYLIKDFSLMHL